MLRNWSCRRGQHGFHHARIYSEMAREGKVKLVGVADANFERAKEVAEKFKTKAFADYRKLIKEVDAVALPFPLLSTGKSP